MCPQPSPGNLIKNAGFDTDLSGWKVFQGSGSVFWQSTDALGCPFSGRARLSWPADAGYSSDQPTISTCVKIQGGSSYNFGVQSFYATGCRLDAYSNPDCTRPIETVAADMQFVPLFALQYLIQMPADARSAEIICGAYTPSDLEFGIDMAYITPAPGLY
jgi:hypothetical protein